MQQEAIRQLADKIREFIATEGRPIAYEQILARGRMHGISVHIIHEALKVVHVFKDVDRKARMGTVYYSIISGEHIPLETPRGSVRTKEQQDEDTALLDRYYVHDPPPWVTSEETECYLASKTDRKRYETCQCSDCAHWRWMLMNERERAVVRWSDERRFLKSLDNGDTQTDTGIKGNERSGAVPSS